MNVGACESENYGERWELRQQGSDKGLNAIYSSEIVEIRVNAGHSITLDRMHSLC